MSANNQNPNDTWLSISFVKEQQNITTCYFVTIMLVLGFISNILNIMISSRKKMLESTVGYYYIFISTFNILVMITAWINSFPSAAGFTNWMLISG